LTGTDLLLAKTQNKAMPAIRAIRVPNDIILVMVDDILKARWVVCCGIPGYSMLMLIPR
jgi:hypothetical protein